MGFISLSHLQLLLGDEGYLCVIPAFEPQSEPILPPSLPHLISLFLPSSLTLSLSLSLLCRLPLFTSNPPVSVSVPVARRWLLPSSVSLCHTLAAPTVSLPLLLSPSIASPLSLSLSLSLALSPSPPHCPSLPCFLVFHSTADLGEIIVGDKFLCLLLT